MELEGNSNAVLPWAGTHWLVVLLLAPGVCATRLSDRRGEGRRAWGGHKRAVLSSRCLSVLTWTVPRTSSHVSSSLRLSLNLQAVEAGQSLDPTKLKKSVCLLIIETKGKTETKVKECCAIFESWGYRLILGVCRGQLFNLPPAISCHLVLG